MQRSNRYTVLFVTAICVICGSVLSVLALLLRGPQERAEELFNSEQLLISARILSHDGYFTVRDGNAFVRARFDGGRLVADNAARKATASEILTLYNSWVALEMSDENKPVYMITTPEGPYGFVIPVEGFGLWDAIYGYICLAPNANTVIGTAWYDQKETPGLGAEISTADWQDQFYGKEIFKGNNFATSPLGIDVVKGVAKSRHDVDGIPGATITSNGVAEAYRQSLAPYRTFLIKTHNAYKGDNG